MKKPLRSNDLRDEFTLAVPPCLFSQRRITHRAPASPIPVTGETGSHYSRKLSHDRLRNQIAEFYRTGSHQLPALCSFKNKASFPSKSLYYGLNTFKHNTVSLSIATI